MSSDAKSILGTIYKVSLSWIYNFFISLMVWALFQALILRAAVLKNQIHVKVSLKCMAVVMHSLWSCFSPASDVDK